MKKTLLVTLDFHPELGGVATYWQRLGEYVPSAQWVVLAPCLPKGAGELAAPYTIIRRALLGRFTIPRWLPLFWHVFITCRKMRIERIVIGHILPVGTVVRLVSAFLHIPYSVSVHGLDITGPRLHKRKKWLCGHIMRHAEWVIVNSKATEAVVKSYGIAEKNIQFVYPCPSITPALLLQPSHGESLDVLDRLRDKKILLTVSRLVPRKGHQHVLRALPGILTFDPDCVYCIIGSGPYRAELEALARTLNIQASVFFLGGISSPEVARWYAACAAFIMTPEDIDGDMEGFGIVYLEAQSFGKAVIGSRVGGVIEAVADGITGILVREGDALEIQRAVIRLLSDADLAKRLGQAGKHRTGEEFQWNKQAEKLQYLLSL
jgi:phosphatidylinositol alpha-1,6-mannosyltransferase